MDVCNVFPFPCIYLWGSYVASVLLKEPGIRTSPPISGGASNEAKGSDDHFRRHQTLMKRGKLHKHCCNRKNAVNAGERMTSTDKMSSQIQRYVVEFQEFCTNKNDKQGRQLQKWKKSADNYLKINVDGAFFQQIKIARLGFHNQGQ
jgi:hypothetical protein